MGRELLGVRSTCDLDGTGPGPARAHRHCCWWICPGSWTVHVGDEHVLLFSKVLQTLQDKGKEDNGVEVGGTREIPLPTRPFPQWARDYSSICWWGPWALVWEHWCCTVASTGHVLGIKVNFSPPPPWSSLKCVSGLQILGPTVQSPESCFLLKPASSLHFLSWNLPASH